MTALNPIIGLSYTETRKLFQALAFAAHKHRDQNRMDAVTSPGIDHSIALANLLVNEGGVADYIVLCAAILHDTLADTQTTHAELVSAFGRSIADVVAEVSDDKALDASIREAMQIEHAVHASPRAKLVKLAEKTCNLRKLATIPPAGESDQHRRAYVHWTKQVVAGLRGSNAALEAAFDCAAAAASSALPTDDGNRITVPASTSLRG